MADTSLKRCEEQPHFLSDEILEFLQVAGVGKDVWSMGSKLSNSIFKPKKVEKFKNSKKN